MTKHATPIQSRRQKRHDWGREHRRKMSATLNLRSYWRKKKKRSYWGTQKDPPLVARNKKLKFEGNNKIENKYI